MVACLSGQYIDHRRSIKDKRSRVFRFAFIFYARSGKHQLFVKTSFFDNGNKQKSDRHTHRKFT